MADAARDASSSRTTRRRVRSVSLRAETVLGLALFALLSALALVPLGRLLIQALGAGEGGAALGVLRDTWSARATGRALGNTLWAAALSVALSVLLGAGLALALGTARVRGRSAATFLVLTPLLVPSQIMALAWIELAGALAPLLVRLGIGSGTGNPIYSGNGIALLMGIEHMPLVFLAARAALFGMPADLVEAARLAGQGRGRIARRVVLPLMLPGVLGGALLAFAAAVGNFGIPALLGIPGRFPVLTTLVYQRLNGFGPAVLPQVAALALILVALALAAVALRAGLARRLAVPVERTGASLQPFASARWDGYASFLVWGAVLVVAVLPALALLAGSLTPALGVSLDPGNLTLRHYGDVLANPSIRRAAANSLALSLGAALACALLAVPVAYLSRLRRTGPGRALEWGADIPFAVPGTVWALAMILAFLPPLPLVGVSIYGTLAILFVSYLGRFLPLVLQPVAASLSALDPALDDAARVSGVRLWRRLALVAAPLAAPAAGAGMLLLFMTALNELTVSALLWSAGTETLGVMVFALQYEGRSPQAAALSCVSVLIVLVLALGFDRLGRRLPPGSVPWRG